MTIAFETKRTVPTLALAVALLLGGCSFASDSLWPSVSGQPVAGAASDGALLSPTQPTLTSASFQLPPLAPVTETGTSVGQKVMQIRGELQQLRDALAARNAQMQALRETAGQSALQYHGTVAAITTKLQLGTTPANPILVGQWNQAQELLDRISGEVAALDTLSNAVAADSGMANYLLDTVRNTYVVPGAIDEDHRHLAVLEDEISATIVVLDRMLTELNEDVRRQSNYVATERSNLSTLSAAVNAGTMLGPSPMNRSTYGLLSASGYPVPAATSAPPGTYPLAGREPLVVIRFDRSNVPYEQPLYNAISQALEMQPQAVFDVVAVAAAAGGAGQAAVNQNASRRDAERVMRSLSEMGLPASRVALSQTSANTPTNEVRIYVR